MVEVAPVVPSRGSSLIRVAGGVWKRTRLTRKTSSSQLRLSGDPSLSDFVLLGRCMMSVKRGGVFHCMRTRFFQW